MNNVIKNNQFLSMNWNENYNYQVEILEDYYYYYFGEEKKISPNN